MYAFDLAVFLQFPASPLTGIDLPAKVLRVIQRNIKEKGTLQHHGNRNSKVV
jgi:hypothetical protein